MAKSFTKLHEQILSILQASSDGVTIHEIRDKLPADIGPQQHLDRRVRDLRDLHDIPCEEGRYFYRGPRTVEVADQGVSAKDRAIVLNKAHGRCQMCGRTIDNDGIKLQVDHKVPYNWGGPSTLENLWAICALCNSGKRDFFKSLNDDEMKRLVQIESVHERLAELLRLRNGPVPSWFLDFVANVNDFQEDWQRRLRELRDLGLEYSVKKSKLTSGKVETFYTLEKWAAVPPDPRSVIRQREKERRDRRED